MRRKALKTVMLVLPAMALAMIGLPALADQDVQSSDGQWKAHAKIADSLDVGKSQEATVTISPAAGGSACPTVSSVLFEMPAHGHGGKKSPSVMSSGACAFHVTDLEPSMGGAWRVRLVLKSGDKTSNADIAVSAK
jgi:hypothetical protein